MYTFQTIKRFENKLIKNPKLQSANIFYIIVFTINFKNYIIQTDIF